MKAIELFTAEQIKPLRKYIPIPDEGPDGWSKSQVDPMKVLKKFKSLRLKEGFILRSYQFRSDHNGNAVVWGMAKDSPFPSPEECPKLDDDFLDSPRPPLALDDLMDAIEGDGSPWSYLSASIFAREISEFGAMWHGCSWSGHAIIDKAPWEFFKGDSEDRESNSKAEDWKWKKEKPTQWQPSVEMNKDKVVVSFYSFSGLCQETIYRHVDTFKAGKYSFKSKQVTIATGVGGYIY